MLEIYFLSECGARTQEKERNVRVYLYNEYALPFPHVVHIRVFLFVMCLLYTVYTAGTKQKNTWVPINGIFECTTH